MSIDLAYFTQPEHAWLIFTKKRLVERLNSIAISQLEDSTEEQTAIDHKAADDLLLMYIDGDELGAVHDAFNRIKRSY